MYSCKASSGVSPLACSKESGNGRAATLAGGLAASYVGRRATAAPSATSLSAQSTDGSATVTVDAKTVDISAVGSAGHSFATRALSSLLPAMGTVD